MESNVPGSLREREEKFRTPQEELAYLRARVEAKEKELGVEGDAFERERIARKEVKTYSEEPAATILHETIIRPVHEITHEALKLKPEEHDAQVDALLLLVAERGVHAALSVAAQMKDAHLEDDLHRALVRYISEGLPVGSSIIHSFESNETWRALHMTLYEVRPEGAHDDAESQPLEKLLASTEQLYAGLLSLTEGESGEHNIFTMEIAVAQGKEDAVFYVSVPTKVKERFERQIHAVFPNALVGECREDYNIFNKQGAHAAAYATLGEHPILPLRTYAEFEHDPMNVLLSAFSKLNKYGEGLALQLVIGNEGDRYNTYYRKILDALQKGESFDEALNTPESTWGTAARDFGAGLKDVLFQPSNDPDAKAKRDRDDERKRTDSLRTNEERIKLIQQKLSSRIVPTTIHIVASAGEEQRAKDLVYNLASAFNQFEDTRGNRIHFEMVKGSPLRGVLHDFVMRIPERARSIPLNFAELTSMFHFTAQGVTSSRELKRTHAKHVPAPIGLPDEGVVLGVNRYGGAETVVRLGAEDRLRHFYEIGQTGTGKTALLKQMAIQDIERGEGVCFIDPHGSDIQDILAAIPPERERDIIYFDPGNIDRPMGLNMLEYDQTHPEQKTFLVDELLGIFRKLYKDVPEAVGPAFEQYFRNSTLLVMEDPESGNTMVDITRVFANESYRAQKLARCKNPLVAQFWRDIASKTEGEQSLANFAQYVTNKFDVFLANEIMRPIIAQERSAFDFRDVMDTRKILLINLSKGRVGEMNSSLLGLIFVGKLLNAALSRVDLVGKEVPPFYVYIDEFQNFTTPSIATILSEARKYKLVLHLAHQFLDQLTDDIRDAVFGNVGTRALFRVGEKDAETLESMVAPEFSASDIANLDNYHAYVKPLVNGKPTRPFSIETLPPKPVDFARVEELKQQSYERYGRPREEVEAAVHARYHAAPHPEDLEWGAR